MRVKHVPGNPSSLHTVLSSSVSACFKSFASCAPRFHRKSAFDEIAKPGP